MQTCAQVLLTLNNLSDRGPYLNARNTFQELLAYDTIPIVNENDTIAVEEIRFGDNDTLSSQVRTLCCLLRHVDAVCIASHRASAHGMCCSDLVVTACAALISQSYRVSSSVQSALLMSLAYPTILHPAVSRVIGHQQQACQVLNTSSGYAYAVYGQIEYCAYSKVS